ncbi:MAG: aldehyde dehydrogenase family protein [Desulfovibrio sp.]|nr:aldehyde dehydrogenase family protein [Desulfovibrio sp.]
MGVDILNPDFAARYQLYINGQWSDASDGGTLPVICPANGKKLCEIADATEADVDRAVAAGWAAFDSWKKMAPDARAAIFLQIADVIEANRDRLGLVESYDQGKPYLVARNGDVMWAADHFRYFASVVRTEEGAIFSDHHNGLNLMIREPLGVVGQIVPWNYPFNMAAWKIAPALAAGCCVVIKPSSHTSLSLLEGVKLFGHLLPPGVLNVITGRGSRSGQFILEHQGLRKLSFTGSTAVGINVAQAAAGHMLPATLELGGMNPDIIFPDTDLDLAVDWLMQGIFANQGEICTSATRAFVHEDIYDEVTNRVVAAAKKIKVGLPWEPDTRMGAICYEGHLNDVLERVKVGIAEGAKLLCGGHRITTPPLDQGFFMEPTVFGDVTQSMTLAQEEIFGPVLLMMKFRTEEEVLKMANSVKYGLAGAVFTKDLDRAMRVSRGIEAGMIYVNQYGSAPCGVACGGYKMSGIGREAHRMTMESFMQVKSIMVNLEGGMSGKNWEQK